MPPFSEYLKVAVPRAPPTTISTLKPGTPFAVIVGWPLVGVLIPPTEP